MDEVRRVNFIRLWFRSKRLASDSEIPKYRISRRTPRLLLFKSAFRVNDKTVRLKSTYLVFRSLSLIELVIHDSRFDPSKVTLKELLGGEVQASSGKGMLSRQELFEQNWADLQFALAVLVLDGKGRSALSYQFGDRLGVGTTLESGAQILLIGPSGRNLDIKVETCV